MNDQYARELGKVTTPGKRYVLDMPVEQHDERCCMNGFSASCGPHPDCPGVQVAPGERTG